MLTRFLVGCFKHATSMQAYCGGEIYYTRLKAQAISFREDSSNKILGEVRVLSAGSRVSGKSGDCQIMKTTL